MARAQFLRPCPVGQAKKLGRKVRQKGGFLAEGSFAIGSKHSLDFIEKAFSMGMILGCFALFEGAEKLFLFFREFDRSFYSDADEEIAFALAVDVRKSFAADAECFAGLGPFWNGDAAGFAERGGDLFFAAEGRFDKRDREFEEDVVAFAGKRFVGFDFDVDKEVAWRAAGFACVSVAAHLEAHAVVDAGGNAYFDPLLFFDAASAVAIFARISDDLARAVALGADARHAEKAAALENLPFALASGASADAVSRFGS